MKRLILYFSFSFFVMISSFAYSQNPYFCTKEGTSIEYIRKNSNGSIKWYHIMDIKEVKDNEDGSLNIICTSTFLKKNKKPKYKSPIVVEVTIIDSNVIIDLSQSVVSMLQSVIGNSLSIQSKGNKTVLPALLNLGDTLENAYSEVAVLGSKMVVSVTNRKVVAIEKLQTSIGVFDSIVIQEEKDENGLGRNRQTTSKTWYSHNIGMLRHDTYDRNGILLTSEVITKLN
jgi:hypothetical protein